ncbi:MAG TPA: hypothetical protein VLJ88_13855 [Propionibacteriaceae bacterium]|nr:hypothetical protein [Propionibacteriaceae bacterium]
MITSQNGWPAYATTDHFTRSSVCGFGYWSANDDVAVVFGEFIHRFDTEVEELTQPKLDDWSYANRLVRGSTSVVSNHGSATAIDLNALKHPRGVHNTFSSAKAAKVRKIKNAITDNSGRPVLRLGMDYTGTVDDMHVEINASAARVKEAADKIRAQAQEDDMPTVADIVAGLRPVIRAEARAQLIDVLMTEELVPNRPTKAALALDPKAPTTHLTVVGALANVEGDQDNDRVADREVDARLEGKLDKLLELLATPEAPA